VAAAHVPRLRHTPPPGAPPRGAPLRHTPG
jgi:hypothetical protein